MNYCIYNDELYHYGVPGMKWGVRKKKSKSITKASRKAARLKRKEAKANAEYEKWKRVNRRHIAKVKVSDLSPKDIEAGQRYAYALHKQEVNDKVKGKRIGTLIEMTGELLSLLA